MLECFKREDKGTGVLFTVGNFLGGGGWKKFS